MKQFSNDQVYAAIINTDKVCMSLMSFEFLSAEYLSYSDELDMGVYRVTMRSDPELTMQKARYVEFNMGIYENNDGTMSAYMA